MVSDQRKIGLAGAGLNGLMAIGFGAFGAHGLKAWAASLPPEDAARILDYVDKGAKYQLVHAAALLALAALPSSPRLRRAAACLLAGPLIFSASLYAMALGAPLWLGAVTPLGGLLMLAGWALILAEGWRQGP
jgi:uncharacterized membrane protein YgdD (TMEM256/DUF423 family)